jgi:hypothetical protein
MTRFFNWQALFFLLGVVVVWLAWPWMLSWIIHYQFDLLKLNKLNAEDILRYYMALGSLLTSLTLAMTVINYITQFDVIARSTLQNTLENQVEALLDKANDLAGNISTHRDCEKLVNFIYKKIMRMPNKNERDAFIEYAKARLGSVASDFFSKQGE